MDLANPPTTCCFFPNSLFTVTSNGTGLHGECPNLANGSIECKFLRYFKRESEKWIPLCGYVRVCVCPGACNENQEYFLTALCCMKGF